MSLAAHLNLILTGFGGENNHTAPYQMRGFQKRLRNMNTVRRSLDSDFNDTSLSGSWWFQLPDSYAAQLCLKQSYVETVQKLQI